MKTFITALTLLISSSSFATQCYLKFKQISSEHGCIEKSSERVLKESFSTVEECYKEAIKLSKNQPLLTTSRVSKVGGCGPDGSYNVTNYSFVEWQYGSLLDFEWPISGEVNPLTEQNVESFQDGNQVYDINGYLIH